MTVYTHSATYVGGIWIDQDIVEPAITQSATEWAFTLTDGTEIHVFGTGFAFDGNGDPTAGTVDSITRTTSGGGTTLEQVNGNGGGSLGISLVTLANQGDGLGPAFNFVMSGADTLTGNTGTDYLYGGAGADTMDGGTGFDYADYSAATAAVQVFLGSAASNTGDAAGDTYTNIEGVRGSAFNDTLAGSNSATGNILLGMEGNDNLRGLDGADTIDGGVGFDEVRYDRDAAAGGGAGVAVNLATGTATDGFGDTDTLISIESIRGTNQVDTLTGGNAASDGFEGYRGLGGADIITGGTGYDEVRYDQDSVNGGVTGVTVDFAAGTAIDGFGATDALSGIEGARGTSQDDTFISASTNNSFYGLAGNDLFIGGDGSDFVGYQNDVFFGATLGVTVNLATGAATDGFGISDTLTGIEAVGGTSHADTFIGDDLVQFWGESFQGYAGNDTITGGLGFDFVRHDNDIDFGGTLGVTVDLSAQTATDGFGNIDTLSGIEGARGTNQSDTFIGNAGILNFFWGLGGGDTFNGGDGNDEVRYEADVDNGGAAGVTVNLAVGVATDGFGNTDTLISIERVGGTNQSDILIGSDADNVFSGQGGADQITGGLGLDEIRYDRDFFLGGSAGVTVNLATNTAIDGFGDTDTLSSIEAARGTRVADTLIGNGEANTFYGLWGDDSIDGGGGNDWVSYSNDIFSREESQILLGAIVDLGTGTATDSFGDADTLISIENAAGGTLGDTLIGSLGDNVFRGLAGNDSIDGQGGTDTVDYSADNRHGQSVFMNGANGVSVNLTAGTATDGFGGTDTLISIENAVGTEFADVLIGSSVANTLTGGAGNDFLDGGDGNDVLQGNAGTDTINGGLGNDTIGGGQDNDTLQGNQGEDVITGGLGNDIIGGGQGNDILQGSQGNDTINGGMGDDVIQGGQDNDTLQGNQGSDTIFGGLGNDIVGGGQDNDILNGGAGSDTIAGGAGIDTAVFAGLVADYGVQNNGGGSWTVTHISTGDVDTLTTMEHLQFDDIII